MRLIAVAIKAKTFVCLEEKEETELIGESSSHKQGLPKCQKQTQYSSTHTHTHTAMKRVLFQTELVHNDPPLRSVAQGCVESGVFNKRYETMWVYIS